MQGVFSTVFEKFNDHLTMIPDHPFAATNQIDEDIRFSNDTKEEADNKDDYLVDQYLAFGEGCTEKAAEAIASS